MYNYGHPHMPVVALLKLALWAIILVLALSFFGISIQAIVNSPAGQANFMFVNDLLMQAWQWAADLYARLQVQW